MEQLLSSTVEKLSAPKSRSLVVEIGTGLLRWQERWRERRRLGAIDDHMLRDIGLSRADIDQEVRKPFWRG